MNKILSQHVILLAINNISFTIKYNVIKYKIKSYYKTHSFETAVTLYKELVIADTCFILIATLQCDRTDQYRKDIGPDVFN